MSFQVRISKATMSRERTAKRRAKSAKAGRSPSNDTSGHDDKSTKVSRNKKRNSVQSNEKRSISDGSEDERNSRSSERHEEHETDEEQEPGQDSRVVVKSLRSGRANGKRAYIVQMPRRDLSPESVRQAIRAHELSRSLTALSMSSNGDAKAAKKKPPRGQRSGRPNTARQRLRRWKPVGEAGSSPQEKSDRQVDEETKEENASFENKNPNGGDVRRKRTTRFNRFKYPERLHYRALPNTHELESRIPFCMRQFPKYTRLPLRQNCVYKPWGSVSYSYGHATGSACLPHPRRGEAKVERPASAPPTARSGNSQGLFGSRGTNSVIGLTDDADDVPEDDPQHLDVALLSPTVDVNDDDDENAENGLNESNGYGNYDYSDDDNDPEDDDSRGQRSSRASSPPTDRRSSQLSSARRSSRGSYDGDGMMSPTASVRSDRPQSVSSQRKDSTGGGSRRGSAFMLARPQSGRRSSSGSTSGRPLSGRRDSSGSTSGRPLSGRRDSSHGSVLSPRSYSDDDIPEEDEDTGDRNSKPAPDRYDPEEDASEIDDEA